METQETLFPEAQPTLESTPSPPGSTGDPAGSASADGTPAGSPASLASQTPLPGFESYFPPAPIELDNSSKSLTETIGPILDEWDREKALSVGACLSIYPSGEITGGFFRKRIKPPPKREGRTISQEFTSKAKKAIRRAVESGVAVFKVFVTLTFDPKKSTVDESGRVIQSWAKKEFKRFLNTVKVIIDRKAQAQGDASFSYIWVAEVQQNGNIHFHMLVDRFLPVKWLVKIWDQAPNSVNVKRLNDQGHAVNYMLKYMKKGSCPIEGKRYGMTQNLLDAIKPQKVRFEGKDRREAFNKARLKCHKEIQKNGGMVSVYGLYIPPHKRARLWRDQKGNIRKTQEVSPHVSSRFLARLELEMNLVTLDKELDEIIKEANQDKKTRRDDLPF